MSAPPVSDPPSRPAPRAFLERQSYRRRRLMDAARLLPLLGAALLAIPLLWPQPGPDGSGGVPMSRAIAYVFTIWALLIILSAGLGVLSRRLARQDDDGPSGTEPS